MQHWALEKDINSFLIWAAKRTRNTWQQLPAMLPTILGTQLALSVISEEPRGFTAQQQWRNKTSIWFLCTELYPRELKSTQAPTSRIEQCPAWPKPRFNSLFINQIIKQLIPNNCLSRSQNVLCSHHKQSCKALIGIFIIYGLPYYIWYF